MFTRKSQFIATAIVSLSFALPWGWSKVVKAQSEIKEVTINFEAWVGDEEFACGESYEDLGTSGSTITPTDYRFYVSDLALINEDGNAIPLELVQDGTWQYQNVALLDFEDKSGACGNGTSETRDMVVGTVPEGDYQSLQFTLGVPKGLNHQDAALAPSPLNLTSMWWNWQGGYKFLRVDLESDNAISNAIETHHNGTGGMSHSQTQTSHQSSSGGNQTSQSSSQTTIINNGQTTHSSSTQTSQHSSSGRTFLIHIGSTGCSDEARSNLFGCANPNRAEIMLEDFNPEDDVVIADLAELLSQTDLSRNQANTPAGCMSSPEDRDCGGIIQNLGLSFNGAPSPGQAFFWVD